MYRIRYKTGFEAAHRLCTAFSKECVSTIHGHSYVVEIFVAAKDLQHSSMVLDFKLVKQWAGEIIGDWDHSVFVYDKTGQGLADVEKLLLGEKIIYCKDNPTAEVMCKMFYDRMQKHFAGYVGLIRLEKIRIHETETGYAEYSAD